MKGRHGPFAIGVVSYNIHGCVGARRQVQPLNVHAIIEQLDPDIVALQEVDGHTALSPGRNQAGIIGEKLNQNWVCFPTDEKGLRAFGLAVISRFEIASVYFDWLPGLHPKLNLRKRGALRATLNTPAGKLHVINTHLSIYKLEAYKQVKALLKGSWLADIAPDEPVLLCGDFNAGPRSGVYKLVARHFTDVQRAVNNGRSPRPTFHSRSPYWRIDHIFVSDHFRPLDAEVRNNARIRTASDHLPLTARLAVQPATAYLRDEEETNIPILRRRRNLTLDVGSIRKDLPPTAGQDPGDRCGNDRA